MASSAGIDKITSDKIKAAMDTVIAEHNGVKVTQGEAMFEKARNMITQLLAGADFEAYTKYRAMKYADFEPTLEMRKAAYKFAFETLLDKVYNATFAG